MGSQENPFGIGDRSLEILNWLFSLDSTGFGVRVPVKLLQSQYQLTRPETEDVIGELESKGVVRVLTPISGAEVELTHLAAEALTGKLAFEPRADVRALAEAISKVSHSVTGSEIHESTGLDAYRINLAARYLQAEGLVDSSRSLGQSEYDFANLTATYQTRKFLGSAQ